MVNDVLEVIKTASKASGRLELWKEVFTTANVKTVCEVGVFRGGFAEHMLSSIPDIEKYYMIDPWRHLPDWRKPANKDDVEFNDIYEEAMAKTEAFADKRIVLRDPTKVAAQSIPDGSLDAIYVDGDHTLRGITIDLIKMLPKMRKGGIVAGDDFAKNVWQHGTDFSPTEVFPFAVYFAEAMDLPVVTLPFNQFGIVNDPNHGFEAIDLGGYSQLEPRDIYGHPSATMKAVKRSVGRFLPDGLKKQLKARLAGRR